MADDRAESGQSAREVTASSLTELPAGVRIGKYQIVSVLGRGGFGITYRATDTQLDREVAIKEYLPTSIAARQADSRVLPHSTQLAEDFRWGRERFLSEAKTLARLERAAGIVNVHDYLEANGTAYMVMALVPGEALDARLRREGRLTQPAIERLLYPLLDGLEGVHRAGFLHRDIKPANILIDDEGMPALIDFGASRMALQGRTQALTAVFTPGYAAFEQMTSAPQGPWTDIYALAATLYHCVAGAPPPSALDRMVFDRLVPASLAGRGNFAPSLLAAIDAGLALKADDRPQSINAWRSILSGVTTVPGAASVDLQTRRMTEPIAPPRRRRWLWPAVVAVALCVAGGAGAYFVIEDRARTAQREKEEATAKVKAEEAARAQKAAEEEAARKAKADAARKAAEEVAARKARAEAARKAAEEEAARKAAADAAARKAAEEEAARKARAEAARKAAEEEAARKTAADAAARKAAEEEAARKARADAARKAAEEEVARKAAAEATAKKAAEEEATRKAAVEAAAKKASEEEAIRKASAEAATKRAAEEEAARKAKADADKAKATGATRPSGLAFRDCPQCPEIVVVRRGSFPMGSTTGEDEREAVPQSSRGFVEPRHQVTLGSDFALGKYPVTRGEFAAFVAATGHNAGNSCTVAQDDKWQDVTGRSWRNPGFEQTDRHPVVCVSLDDAWAYVAWLKRTTGKAYRLPTEAEWEYAARAGTTTARYWGDSRVDACRYANVFDLAIANAMKVARTYTVFPCSDGYVHTSPVGSFAANAWGLHDMLGNAYQWTADCWHPSYQGAPTDGRPWQEGGDCSRRVVRGGSWHTHAWVTRAATRVRYTIGARNFQLGFRVARDN